MDSFTPYNGAKSGDFMQAPGKTKRNKGISCGVKNCVYHDGINTCTAEQIAVGPTYANSVSDTVCATFKQKKV